MLTNGKSDLSEDEHQTIQNESLNNKRAFNSNTSSSINEKYLNLRKLNPNRIEKFNHLNYPSSSSIHSSSSNNITEFLSYFNLVEVEKPVSKCVPIELTSSHLFDTSDHLVEGDEPQTSFFDRILNTNTTSDSALKQYNFKNLKIELKVNESERKISILEFLVSKGGFVFR